MITFLKAFELDQLIPVIQFKWFKASHLKTKHFRKRTTYFIIVGYSSGYKQGFKVLSINVSRQFGSGRFITLLTTVDA